MFLKPGICPPLLAQHPGRLFLVERHRALELRRPDARVDLRRVDARVAEQRADLFEVVMLLQHLHRHAVPQIVRLEIGAASPRPRSQTPASSACRAHPGERPNKIQSPNELRAERLDTHPPRVLRVPRKRAEAHGIVGRETFQMRLYAGPPFI